MHRIEPARATTVCEAAAGSRGAGGLNAGSSRPLFSDVTDRTELTDQDARGDRVNGERLYAEMATLPIVEASGVTGSE